MPTTTKTLHISGMSCISCQKKIEKALRKTGKIESVSVSYKTGEATVVFDESKISLEELKKEVKNAGYEVRNSKESQIGTQILFLFLIFFLFFLLQKSGILNSLAPSKLAESGMSYGMLFVIGLLTSVHCVAMCGGINLSQCIGSKEKPSLWSASLYNLGRVISYTSFGFVFGLIGMLAGGEGAGLPTIVQGIFKLIAGALMIIMGINMLGLIPPLRKLTIHPPKKLAAKIGKWKIGKGAFVVGILNGFMPCGPLQSMQLVALASGNPFAGALSMLAFSLGTVPLMLGLGSVITMLGKKFASKVMTAGSVLVVVLGLAMVSQGLALADISPVRGKNVASVETDTATVADEAKEDDIQEVRSTLESGSYPEITVKAGTPVKWVIDASADKINGCNYKFFSNSLGFEHTLTEGENVIEFTPEETGDISYTCWMGMIQGTIHVVDADADIENVPTSTTNQSASRSCCSA